VHAQLPPPIAATRIPWRVAGPQLQLPCISVAAQEVHAEGCISCQPQRAIVPTAAAVGVAGDRVVALHKGPVRGPQWPNLRAPQGVEQRGQIVA
jgi:hypothetical protein